MKKLMLLSAILLNGVLLYAAKITVDNSPESAAQYSNLQTACTNANDGDTVFVYGTPYNYGTLTLDKRVVLVGSGAFPQVSNEQAPTVTYIYFNSGATGSVVTGFSIGDAYPYTGTVDDVWLFNNKFTGSYGIYSANSGSYSNWIIEGNVFIQNNPSSSINLGTGTSSNWLIKNNYFETLNDYAYPLSYINSTITLRNNIFVYGLNYAYNLTFFNASTGGVLENNIFAFISPNQTNIQSQCPNCVFNNNIIYNTGGGTMVAPSNGGNNIINQAPVFVNQQVPFTAYNVNSNYNLANGSPGENAGTDGQDVGLFGGNFNWHNRLYPKLFPHQEVVDVINQSVPQGTPVNVNLKAKKAYN